VKLLGFPVIVSAVLFPAFSMSYGRHPERTAYLLERGCTYLMIVFFPIILALIVFARRGLGLWMGSDFADHSAGVLQGLGVGVFAGSVGVVFYAVVQGAGRPDLTAKLHVIESIPYVLALWFLIGRYGIVGAAVAWTGRILAELPLLFWLTGRLLRGHTQRLARLGVAVTLCLAVLLLAITLGFKSGVALLALVLAVGGPVAWWCFLDGAERLFLSDCASRALRAWK